MAEKYKDKFDINDLYGDGWKKIDWKRIEKTQIGIGPGESVVYHNRSEILKVFEMDYSDPGPNNILDIYQYTDALNVYKKRHDFWSKKEIHIDPKEIARWDLVLQDFNNDTINKLIIKNIVVKTVSLSESVIDVHENDKVAVVTKIPYIHGTSLQSLCDYTRAGIPALKDTWDQRAVKVWAEEIYRIWYDISRYIDNMVYKNYGIFLGKIMLSFTKYGYIGLIPKNIKLTGVDIQTQSLEFTITDRCSSIMLWYVINHQKEAFNLFVEKDLLEWNKKSVLDTGKELYDQFKHSIDRLYVHK